MASPSLEPVKQGSTGAWQQRAMLACAQTEKEVLLEGCTLWLLCFGRGGGGGQTLLNAVLLSNIG